MHKLTICFMLIFFFSFGAVIAQEVMTVETDIIVPQDVIQIEVADYVYVGNITWGFDDETDKNKIYINNTGTVDVRVTSDLVEYDEIFSYLHFANRTYNDYEKIGGNWKIDIEAPDEPGGYESDYFYMKLDLTNYSGDFEEDVLDHRAQIEFIAVEQ